MYIYIYIYIYIYVYTYELYNIYFLWGGDTERKRWPKMD